METPRVVHLEALLSEAQHALRRGAWAEGRALFEAALAADETPEAHDGLATCCRFIGALDESLAARERAYRLYRDRGDLPNAVIAAAWLGRDSGLPRAEGSVARAWFSVARRLAGQTDSALAHATLDYYEGQFALLGELDAPRAGELGARARAAGYACGNLDLEMQGLSLEGVALVAEGRVSEGMARVEEAAAAVLGGDLSGADVAGWICCHVVYACDRVSDTRRAAEWCGHMRGFCERWDMPGMFGMCLSHHASLLMHEGRWSEAEAELTEAANLFASAAPALSYESLLRTAELRLRQGRLDEVDALCGLLEPFPIGWAGLPCRAAAALERCDAPGAIAFLDRYHDLVPERERTGLAWALEIAVQARIACGDLGRAGRDAGALADLAAVAETDRLRGIAELARGRVLAARGDPAVARGAIELAADLFTRAGAPFDLAGARFVLGEVLLDLQEPELAVQALTAARDGYATLGAFGRVERVDERLAKVGTARPGGRWTLSERELDVLRLAADGLSNADIGRRLDISTHTVHRHMANIRTKLGGESKAAVVAAAMREGLI